jgi:cytochrome oxidase Cu insertion factor (SCO1/SenC/PrrC family)
MRRTIIPAVFLLLVLAITLQGQQTTPSPQPAAAQPQPPKTHLKVGQPAPEFALTDTAGKPVKLSDFKGKKNVVLAFYVLAFTGG